MCVDAANCDGSCPECMSNKIRRLKMANKQLARRRLAVMSDELKPCPFCGCADDLEHGYETEDREGVPCWVYCSECGAQGPWAYVSPSLSTTATVDQDWNRRADLVDAEIERLQGEIEELHRRFDVAVDFAITETQAAERQRARLPEALVEQIHVEIAFLSARNEGPDQRPLQVLRDILAWHEQGGRSDE